MGRSLEHVIDGNPKGYRLRLVIVWCTLVNAWFSAVLLWILVPLFLGAVCCIYVPTITRSPVVATVSLAFAFTIASLVLIVTRLMIRSAHRELHDLQRLPTPDSR